MTVIPGRKKRKEFLKELNRHLDKGNTKGRKRAYVAIPIDRPEAKQLQPEPQEQPQTVPADDLPEVFEILPSQRTFNVNPDCGDEVFIHVINTSDPVKAQQKAESYLKRHAQDLLEAGQLDTRQHEQNCTCSNEWLN
ncbi:hypothetical protein [Gimesia chilikensis]|uniref:Uncharacterized protein n=1 Tax=Gimesia chilikensis TaxID=2605989 RepID=A0A517PIK5_9PLAN|nr:hypothetical protein [Gimesia chilikensis]QDT19213.1 hypothetical protein HG66A1_09770 [Gimesia chilikensis]